MQTISDVTLAESAASEPIPVTGGTATLYVNNKKEGSGSIDKTQPNVLSSDETGNVTINLK